MAHMSFKWDSKELDSRLAALPAELDRRINETVQASAERIEVEMKIKAPWTDRGGPYYRHPHYVSEHARAGLYARADSMVVAAGVHRYTITAGHTASYGKWLETIQNGKWQIIMPTVKSGGEALLASMVGILNEGYTGPAVATFGPGIGERGTSQGLDTTSRRGVRTFTRIIRRSLKGKVWLQYRDTRSGRYIKAVEALRRRI
jgi:hypothetical protein